MTQAQACALLKQMLGPDAEFRDDQWEAIDQIVTLLTVLLQQRGSGPVHPFALAKASPRGG